MNRLAAVFYPHRCFICDKALRYPANVCEACRAKLLRYSEVNAACCDVCGLKLRACICRPGRLYEKAVFPLYFEGDTRVSLHKMKFRGRLDKVKPFAEAIFHTMNERGVTEKTDLLTFIPMEPKKERRRGYNQAQLLCEEISALSGIPMLKLLYKCQSTDTQHDVSSFLYRSGNALGVYDPLPEATEEIQNKRILLIDDILTTGSTLNEAAKTLLIFGADAVYVAAAAAVPKKTK